MSCGGVKQAEDRGEEEEEDRPGAIELTPNLLEDQRYSSTQSMRAK